MAPAWKILQATMFTLMFVRSTADIAGKKVFSVVDYGAIPDETKDSTEVSRISFFFNELDRNFYFSWRIIFVCGSNI